MGESDAAFDRKVMAWLGAAEHDALNALTVRELHEAGGHELLNWMVAAGAMAPARAREGLLRRAGPHQPRRGGVGASMSRYAVDSLVYRLKKDADFRARFAADRAGALAEADLTDP